MSKKQTDAEEITGRDHAELLMLYQVTIGDIEKAKQWGWIVTYATIAAQGAILGLFYAACKTVTCLSFVKAIFLVSAIVLAILAIYYIEHSQSRLDVFRKRLNEIRDKFGEHFKACSRESNESSTKKRWPLECVVVFATLFVCILIILDKMNTLNGYECISATAINSLGLLFSLVGAVLLLFFGLPIQVAIPGKTTTSGGKWEYKEEDQKKIRQQKRLWRIGLYLLIAGFLLQLIGNLIRI